MHQAVNQPDQTQIRVHASQFVQRRQTVESAHVDRRDPITVKIPVRGHVHVRAGVFPPPDRDMMLRYRWVSDDRFLKVPVANRDEIMLLERFLIGIGCQPTPERRYGYVSHSLFNDDRSSKAPLSIAAILLPLRSLCTVTTQSGQVRSHQQKGARCRVTEGLAPTGP